MLNSHLGAGEKQCWKLNHLSSRDPGLISKKAIRPECENVAISKDLSQ
jgi:hypothetical protein